jgi:predicted RNA binding protein YcfA (HicA-like mRNA interferase family)
MPKLPRLSGRELIKILELFEFVEIRQKGSHIILKKKTGDGSIGTVVPDHKELAEGTIKGILKQAQITIEEFLEAYHK